MEIKNFVQIYDNVLPLNAVGSLIKFANKINFEKATVSADKVENFNIRRTYCKRLSNLNNSLTETHWHNLLQTFFKNCLIEYQKSNNILDYSFKEIFDISILKYEETGFYTWHTDHFSEIPRTMSCILLLNNDYDGGNLCFRNPDGKDEWCVETKPSRMIIWPSNFLYPHTVKPVTKGIRYSVVAWAL
jgi:hypothetical protein